MTSDKLLFILIDGVVLLLVGFVLYKIQTKKPKLISYLINASIFSLPGTQRRLGTHSITIQNTGRGKAESVEVYHNALPLIDVIPDSHCYELDSTPQGSQIIKFNNLLSKDKITIAYLYEIVPNMPNYLPFEVKSKEGKARIIQTIPTPVYSKWIQFLSGALMLLGAMFIVYLIYELILHFI